MARARRFSRRPASRFASRRRATSSTGIARPGAGDVVLAEDLTGRGHVTRVVGDQPRVYAIVPLAET